MNKREFLILILGNLQIELKKEKILKENLLEINKKIEDYCCNIYKSSNPNTVDAEKEIHLFEDDFESSTNEYYSNVRNHFFSNLDDDSDYDQQSDIW